MPLKVKMNLTESVKQENPDNESSSDEVDGLASQLGTDLPGIISNNYKTTLLSNYANSPLSANSEYISHQKHESKTDQEINLSNAHESDKPLDDNEPISQKSVVLQGILNTTEKEPLPDHESLNRDAKNDQEVATIEPELFIEPSNEGSLAEKKKQILKSIEDQFESSVKLASQSKQPLNITPKLGSHYGSYLIDKKVPEGVKLSNNRELVKEKSTKPAETESFLAIKNASHYRTSYIDGSAKVVLSAEGLMTRNLNEKLDYAKQSQGE